MQADQNAAAEKPTSPPDDPPPPPPVPTQIRHPWRATARTIVAAVVGALALVPIIATTAKLDTIPLVAGAVAVTGAVTRVLAIPAVDGWLHDFLPWLATTSSSHSK
jgi:hypothetical protein